MRLRPSICSDFSNFYRHIDEIESSEQYLVLQRVSESDQYKNGNLFAQKVNVPHEIRIRGGISVLMRKPDNWFVASGSGYAWEQKVIEAFARCHKRKYAGIVVASPSRMPRNYCFNPNIVETRNIKPTNQQFERLLEIANGKPIYCITDPNATYDEETALFSAWGKEIKNETGTSEDRAKFLQEKGVSIREIAKFLQVYPSTIQKWLSVAL